MKTAVSLPDELFQEAEQAARRLGLSRSEVYARALRAWLADLRQDSVTEALDLLYSDQPSDLEPGLSALQAASLPTEW